MDTESMPARTGQFVAWHHQFIFADRCRVNLSGNMKQLSSRFKLCLVS